MYWQQWFLDFGITIWFRRFVAPVCSSVSQRLMARVRYYSASCTNRPDTCPLQNQYTIEWTNMIPRSKTSQCNKGTFRVHRNLWAILTQHPLCHSRTKNLANARLLWLIEIRMGAWYNTCSIIAILPVYSFSITVRRLCQHCKLPLCSICRYILVPRSNCLVCYHLTSQAWRLPSRRARQWRASHMWG